jgi:amino acid adenylation domain-containing protein
VRPELTIPRRFAQQAALHRDRPAVSTRDGIWTYGELDRRARGIAAALPAAGPVALLLPHGAPAVAALLGVLQAGGLYVPLDPAAPPDRLAAILSHAEPAALITDRRHFESATALAGERLPVIDVDTVSEASPSALPDADPGDACVLFYTAGSTGSPKGVVQSHRGVLHNVANHTEALHITPADRLTLLSPLTAAASATALFSALLNGACLCPFSVRREGLAAMAAWMARERITLYHSVPTLFRHFLESLSEGEPLASLRVVKLGGEPLPRRDLDLFRRLLPAGCRIVNGLGITEAGGNVCHYSVEPEAVLAGATVPVGHPLPDVGVLLLDEEGCEVAPTIGAIGEIAVRGRYLSLGYWRDPERTAAAFQTLSDGEVLYRTGDLGRWVGDDGYEHLGRKDRQVKIRGHRVDLTEVEEELLALPGVREAAAVPCGGESLAAFLVPDSRGEQPVELPPSGELRALLARRLPEPMIPGRFLILAKLPLLPGGKIDRAALGELAAQASSPVAPSPENPAQNALELQIREIWRRAFGYEVGLADDFFALGGHSLIAAKIATGVQRALGLSVPLSTLAAAPTIPSFARALRHRGWTDAANPLVPLQAGGDRPPFFCVPGAGSDVLSFLALSRRLGPDQPFYGLQPRGVDGSRQFHRTVEEMATHFVEHLTAFQPEGAFRLGGSSFGGVVAFEMARQLQQRGREVELLALLDSYGGDYPRPRPGWSLRRLARRFLRWCLPVAEKENISWASLRRGLRERAQRLRANLDMAFPRLSGVPPVELRFLYLQEVCFRARRIYRPQPFTGRIILFRTERQPPAGLFEPDPELGWSGLSTAGITVHDVPGHHGLHLREPAVGVLAERLAPYLACS